MTYDHLTQINKRIITKGSTRLAMELFLAIDQFSIRDDLKNLRVVDLPKKAHLVTFITQRIGNLSNEN